MKAVKKHGKINQEVVCVDKQSKYNGVVKAIIHDIDQGVLQARDRLPSEKELQERFGVSRVTVRKAVDVLIEEGYDTSLANCIDHAVRFHSAERNPLFQHRHEYADSCRLVYRLASR